MGIVSVDDEVQGLTRVSRESGAPSTSSWDVPRVRVSGDDADADADSNSNSSWQEQEIPGEDADSNSSWHEQRSPSVEDADSSFSFEPSTITSHPNLWRMDPEESHSDWVVEIETEGDHSPLVETYHIHKVMVAVGPCKSKFLANLFSHGVDPKQGRGVGVTRIQLESLLAQCFPNVLDFLYSQGTSFKLCTANAVPTLYLAEYLGIPLLGHEVSTFLKQDLTMGNADIYYQHASKFSQEGVMRSVERVLVDNIHHLKPTSRILNLLDVPSMVGMLAAVKLPPKKKGIKKKGTHRWSFSLVASRKRRGISCHLSQLVAAFIDAKDIDEENFLQLTQESFLPFVDYSVAAQLIKLERKITGKEMDPESSLNKRCFHTIQKNFKKGNIGNDVEAEILDLLRSAPSRIAVDILIGCESWVSASS